MYRILFFVCAIFLCAGCQESKSKFGRFSIGRDPSWFPLNFGTQNSQVNGFVNALVIEIAKVEKIPMRLIDTDWLVLMRGLEEDLYAGMLSPLEPTIENKDLLTFSEPFLNLGQVLIVNKKSPYASLDQMKGKRIGISQFDDSVLIAQKYPVLITSYQEMPLALEDLARGVLDGVLMGALEAYPLVLTTYKESLEIVSPPLTDKGLRLITFKGMHPSLQIRFRLGLEKLRKSGKYESLLKTYFLPSSTL